MKKICGMIPALITPYDSTGNVNIKVLREIVRMNIKNNVAGFYTTGSTGEAFLLSTEERKKTLEIVREETVNGLVIAHVGSTVTREAIELARHAKDVGADMVASVPPFYYQYTKEEIKQYYRDIAEASQMPVMIYNIPGTTGVSLDYDSVGDFFKEDFIKGLKFTSKDFYQLERIKTNYPKLSVFNGFDEVVAGSFIYGADGGIGSTYNIMGGWFVSIYNAILEKDYNKAGEIQRKINEVIEQLIKTGIIRGIKYILQLMGYECGMPRKPFREINELEKSICKEILLKLL